MSRRPLFSPAKGATAPFRLPWRRLLPRAPAVAAKELWAPVLGPKGKASSVRRGARGRTLEFGGELPGDTIGQGIGEHQHVDMAVVVGLDVGRPVFFQSGDHLIGCEAQMLTQHRLGLSFAPVRIGAAEKGCNVVAIGVPFLLRGR